MSHKCQPGICPSWGRGFSVKLRELCVIGLACTVIDAGAQIANGAIAPQPVEAASQLPLPKTQGTGAAGVGGPKKGVDPQSPAGNDASIITLPAGSLVIVPSGAAQILNAKKDEPSTVLAILTAVAWPVAAIVIAIVLLRTQEIRDLLSRVSHKATELKVAGLQITLSEGAAATIDDLQKLVDRLPKAHEKWAYNSRVVDQFGRVIQELQGYLKTASGASGKRVPPDDYRSFRFTLHVRDVLLNDSYRQLVNYVGADQGRAGRVFSTRRGIVGLVWRLETSTFLCRSYTSQDLIEKWGMTSSEARATRKDKKAYLAVLLRSEIDEPLGILYADSESSTLFENPQGSNDDEKRSAQQRVFDGFATKVREASTSRGLTKSLQDLEESRSKIVRLDLYHSEE